MTKLKIQLLAFSSIVAVTGGSVAYAISNNDTNVESDTESVVEETETKEVAAVTTSAKSDEVSMYSDTPYTDCWNGYVQCDKDGNYLSEDYCISNIYHDGNDILCISTDYLDTLSEEQSSGDELIQLDDSGYYFGLILSGELEKDEITAKSEILENKMTETCDELSDENVTYGYYYIDLYDYTEDDYSDYYLVVGYVRADNEFNNEAGDSLCYYEPLQWTSLDIYQYYGDSEGLIKDKKSGDTGLSTSTGTQNSKIGTNDNKNNADYKNGTDYYGYSGRIDKSFALCPGDLGVCFANSNWEAINQKYTPTGGEDSGLIVEDWYNSLTSAQKSGQVFKLNIGQNIYAVVSTQNAEYNGATRTSQKGYGALEAKMQELARNNGVYCDYAEFVIGGYGSDGSELLLLVGYLTNGWKWSKDGYRVESLYELVDFTQASYYNYFHDIWLERTQAETEANVRQAAIDEGTAYYDENGNIQDYYICPSEGDAGYKTEEEYRQAQAEAEAESNSQYDGYTQVTNPEGQTAYEWINPDLVPTYDEDGNVTYGPPANYDYTMPSTEVAD